MPNESQNARSFLEDRRTAVLAELRRLAPELINEFLKLNAAIAAMDETAETVVDEYYGFRKPLDAIGAYLDKKGKPAPRRTIAKVLEEGGFARGQVQRPFWNVLSAIDYHLEQSKSEKKRFVEINGLLGKVEWPEEMFK